MEIQQHDGVVVDVAGSRQGFAKLLREGEVLQGEREAPGAVVLLPSLPPLYIGPLGGGGGAGPGSHLQRVCYPRGFPQRPSGMFSRSSSSSRGRSSSLLFSPDARGQFEG